MSLFYAITSEPKKGIKTYTFTSKVSFSLIFKEDVVHVFVNMFQFGQNRKPSPIFAETKMAEKGFYNDSFYCYQLVNSV